MGSMVSTRRQSVDLPAEPSVCCRVIPISIVGGQQHVLRGWLDPWRGCVRIGGLRSALPLLDLGEEPGHVVVQCFVEMMARDAFPQIFATSGELVVYEVQHPGLEQSQGVIRRKLIQRPP